MNIEHLRTFLDIASTGSFHRTAERLNVTQSTVSARVKALETQLDRPLFARLRSGVALTAAGRRLRRHAETAVKAWEQGRQSVGLPEALRTVVGFGVQMTLWERLGVPWLRWMRETAPDHGLNVTADYSDALMRQLDDGLLDLAVMFVPRTRASLVIEELFSEELILVSTTPRTAEGGWMDDYILMDWGWDFRQSHSEAYPDMQTPAVTVGTPDLALSHILETGGSAYLPRTMVGPQLADGILHEVFRAPSFLHPTFVVYPAEPLDPERLALALDGLREVAEA